MAQESWDPSDSCQQQAAPQQQQQPDGLALCSNNCGLLASTMNLCSKCFRELSLQQGNASSLVPKSLSLDKDASAFISKLDDKGHVQQLQPQPSSEFRQMQSQIVLGSPNGSSLQASCRSLPSSSADKPIFSTQYLISGMLAQDATAQSSSSNAGPARRQPANRCLTCKKRTGLLGFKCRCGNVFCAHHRYSDKHDCPYDYKSAAKAAIAKANPVVKAQKITKI